MMSSHLKWHRLARVGAMLGLLALAPAGQALAQSIAVTVNGDPITTTEVDEQMKYLRLIHEPTSRDDAIESLVGDRIKLRQANKYGIDASDASLTQTLSQIALKAKTNANALVQALQAAKLNTDLVRSHIRSLAAWNEYVRSRNKSLSVSEEDVSAAIAKDAKLQKGDTDYTLQQIVFVVPVGASPAVIEQRTREAQALRQRFQDCSSGLPLARALPDVAIKPPITKTAGSLSAATKTALEQTSKGRLTAPDRTAAGVEMIAVCGVTDDADKSSVRDTVQARLLTERLSTQADQLYKEVRALAVVEKR